MKKLLFSLALFSIVLSVFAQKVVLSPTTVADAVHYDKSLPLRDITPIPPKNDKLIWEDGIVYNNMEKREYLKDFTPENIGPDPVRQNKMGTKSLKSIGLSFEGIDKAGGGGATPPDTDGDVGPNHYFQMINTAFQIYDKSGASLYGPADNSTIFDGWDDGQPWDNHNDGDPIVLYDETVDRWLVTHFSINFMTGPYYILMAVSETSDPLGAYYRYAFEFNDMPDYPKFGIWHDGYYMTLNSNTQNTTVFERDSMLVGAPARMIAFELPDYPGSGFKSALAADCDGTLPPPGSPNYIIYYNDDAWGSYPTDHLRIWEFQTDWVNTANSTLSLATTLPTAPFDSQFSGGFANIPQPGTAQKIDAIMGAVMFRMQYRNFGTHESIVLNFPVDVDGNDQAGIRWYELRNLGTEWYILQEGTYAPDTDSRFVGSIAMDINGNIGLAYSVSSSAVYPSLRFTGHTNNAPPGVMNIIEQEIMAGSGSQNGTDRYGDYAMLSVDPVDNETFWFTSEYIPASGNWNTRIATFTINPDELVPVDVGVQSMISPVSSVDLTATETITVQVGNYGTDTISDIPVSYEFNGGGAVSEIIPGPVAPAMSTVHSFAQTVDMSAEGVYDIVTYTHLAADTIPTNDTLIKSIEHAAPSYCLASGGGAFTSIDDVQFYMISNSSTYTDYSDYTAISTPVSLNETYALSVTITPSGFGSDDVIVWIDWNQDLDFEDAGEKTIVGVSNAPYTVDITVPSDALLGSTRMRVRLHNTFSMASPNDTPCGVSGVGEVEDYTLIIEDGLNTMELHTDQLNLQVSPNPSKGKFKVQFNNLGIDLDLQIIDQLGKVVYTDRIEKSEATFKKTISLDDQAAGLYFIRVRTKSAILIAKKIIITE